MLFILITFKLSLPAVTRYSIKMLIAYTCNRYNKYRLENIGIKYYEGIDKQLFDDLLE
jgi:hypothetical protein